MFCVNVVFLSVFMFFINRTQLYRARYKCRLFYLNKCHSGINNLSKI